MLTVFGAIAVSIMFLSYWTEEYSGLAEVCPITVIEGLWALAALRRFAQRHQREKENAGA